MARLLLAYTAPASGHVYPSPVSLRSSFQTNRSVATTNSTWRRSLEALERGDRIGRLPIVELVRFDPWIDRRGAKPEPAKALDVWRPGLEPLRHLEELFLRSHRFILFTAEPHEYPRSDWPASVRLVGPLTWEPPAPTPSWVSAETRPLVLVTASTVYQRDDKLIATALSALAEEQLAVVATTGALDPRAFEAPANAHVEAFLPHTPIVKRAACVVPDGGMGITQKALAAGVPVCVVPFCRDQFEVARRVDVSRAGTRLHHKRLTAKRLREAVHATICMRPGAQRVAKAFARAGGAQAAADAVEELLRPEHGVRRSSWAAAVTTTAGSPGNP